MKSGKKLFFHNDAGHGWLAVPRKLIKELGIEEKISAFSYIRGKTVYLEEDDDCFCFFEAIKEAGRAFLLVEKYKVRSPIRGYDFYSIEKFNAALSGE